MLPPLQTLYFAQTDVPSDGVHQVLTGCMFLLIMAIVAMVATFFVRRWFKRDEPTGQGFTIDDLRKLHKDGKMSEAEFKVASSKLAGAMKAQFMASGTAKPDIAGVQGAPVSKKLAAKPPLGKPGLSGGQRRPRPKNDSGA